MRYIILPSSSVGHFYSLLFILLQKILCPSFIGLMSFRLNSQKLHYWELFSYKNVFSMPSSQITNCPTLWSAFGRPDKSVFIKLNIFNLCHQKSHYFKTDDPKKNPEPYWDYWRGCGKWPLLILRNNEDLSLKLIGCEAVWRKQGGQRQIEVDSTVLSLFSSWLSLRGNYFEGNGNVCILGKYP